MQSKQPSRKRDPRKEAIRAFQKFGQTHGLELQGANSDRVLAKAVKEGDAKVFSLVLQLELHERGLEPPRGVFTFSMFPGRAGRPRKMKEALAAWLEYNRLPEALRSFGKVAKVLLPEEYAENPTRAANKVRQLYRGLEDAFRQWVANEDEKISG